MKVAYFIGSLNRGGTEMLTLDICRQQMNAPYEMMLVYRNDGDLSDAFRATGVQMIRIKPKRLSFLSYMFHLRRLMQNEHVDIVHAQTLANGVTAVFLLLGTKVRLVTTFHGFFYGFVSAIFRHIVMWGSDATVYVSNYVREWYLNHSWCNPKKCHTVYNGVNFEKIDSAEPCSEFPQNGRIRLAMVGNFVSVRSQNIIVKSILLLKERGIVDFDFYFVGRRVDTEGHLYDDCVCLCEDNGLTNVHFLGSRGDVPSILKAMDGFVYSTVNDTFGIAVVEAMAAGLPVVVNDWAVMKEICGNEVLMYETGNATDCAEKMEQLIKNIHSHKEHAKESSTIIRERFSIEKNIKNLSALYGNVMGK